MKKVTLKNVGSFFAVAALFVSLNGCENADVSPEATLAAQNTEEARSEKSLNLNKVYEVEFDALNNSGVSGMATLILMGDMLTVKITASGLEPNKTHAQHIHGFMETKKNAVCPPMSADKNNNGLVELAEGLPFYGPVLLPLTPLPTADANGMIMYEQTFKISPDLLPLQNRVVVLHGLTVMGTYMPSLPVACGQIKPSNNGKK